MFLSPQSNMSSSSSLSFTHMMAREISSMMLWRSRSWLKRPLDIFCDRSLANLNDVSTCDAADLHEHSCVCVSPAGCPTLAPGWRGCTCRPVRSKTEETSRSISNEIKERRMSSSFFFLHYCLSRLANEMTLQLKKKKKKAAKDQPRRATCQFVSGPVDFRAPLEGAVGLVVAHDLLLYGGRVVSEWRHLNHALQDGEDVSVSALSALIFDTVKKHFKMTKTSTGFQPSHCVHSSQP